MKPIQIAIGGRTFRLGHPVDLAIPLDFHGDQPNAYGVPPASAVPYGGDGFLLDTQQDGPCNCDTLTIMPHCHGTHTECVGHITHDRVAISDLDIEPFLAATLITVNPSGREIREDEIEKYKYDVHFLEALIVRTMPNDVSKKSRRWENDTTPYFTPAAMQSIRELGVQHLLVDLPSLDAIYDYGKLLAHRTFWSMKPGDQAVPHGDAAWRTITEMIFVPDSVPDGRYGLSLQLPRFVSDAAPSRPILFHLDDEL